MTPSKRSTTDWAGRLALAALVLWGLIHIAGGISLLGANVVDGLEALGPNTTGTVPSDPGDATEALLRFHSLNVALGGVAVLVLAVAWWRTRQWWQLDVAVVVAAALDVGLIVFLVMPEVLPAGQGLIGPVLVVIAVVGAAGVHRAGRPRAAIT